MSSKKNNTINNTKEHEPVIEVEEMGVMEEPALQPPVPMQPQGKKVKDVLIEDVNFLRGMNFTTDEVEKFGLIIAKVKQDLISCIAGIEREEQRLAGMKKEGEHAATGNE